MRLVSFVYDGQIRIGAIRTDGARELVFDLNRIEPRLPSKMEAFLESGKSAFSLAAQALAHASVEAGLPLEGLALKAPVPRPGKIIAIGQNYLMHVEEAKQVASEYPIIFAKYNNTVIGSGEPIVLPKLSQQVDYEGELGVVIGKRCKGVPFSEALSCVGGYTALNDVSARDYQHLTSQWTMGKSFDTFAPMGPALLTADEVADPQNLNLRVTIGGEELQSANTRDMIFSIAQLISTISAVMTLDPGDVIATGTPGGIGGARTPPRWLRPGEVVRVEIERIGVLENPIVAET
jgi:2-keto-4-pentenoate hydratase/2-oxohepta-3-ene-1,7-dioic acid hydratase in catechol pathway